MNHESRVERHLSSIDKSLKRISDVMEKRERREQHEHDYIKEQIEGSGKAEQEADRSTAQNTLNVSVNAGPFTDNPDDLLEQFNQQYKKHAQEKDIRNG